MARSNGVSRGCSPAGRNAPTTTHSSVLRERYDAESWRPLAACRDVNSDLFFPIGSTGAAVVEIAQAKAVCAGCPVRRACLAFAVTTNQEFGIWGGQDERERPALRRQWRAAVDGGMRQ